MTVLVTGAAGFIGSAVTRRLLSDARGLGERTKLIALDALSRVGDWEALGSAVSSSLLRMVRADIRAVGDDHDLFRGVDLVVHCAAESSVDASFGRAEEFWDVNVEGTRAIALSAREAGVGTFIHFSTDEVYGECLSGSNPETTPLNPTNPYAKSKAEAEQVIWEVLGDTDTRVVVLRPSNNYGPWQVADNLIPKFVSMLDQGTPAPLYGNGEHRRCWVHVEDTVDAAMTLVDNAEANGTFNIGGEEMSNREVIDQILREMNLNWNAVESVAGRPINDSRYCNDESKLRSLGFERKRVFAQEISSVVAHYRGRAGSA